MGEQYRYQIIDVSDVFTVSIDTCMGIKLIAI